MVDGETPIKLLLCGDVMTGRGIDQVLPHPVDPTLYEPGVRSACEYVTLAEIAHGPIPRGVDFAYVWGDAVAEFDRRCPHLRLINLETAVTRSEAAASKGINYRMSPENFSCITVAGIDACALANNHVLDWGRDGLVETLETLQRNGVRAVGAGRTRSDAAAPAVIAGPGGARIVVFAFGSTSSGIPRGWAATESDPGVNLLPDLSIRTAHSVAEQVRRIKRHEDVTVVSIHWGANWGYDVPKSQRAFAHTLIDDAGVDVVHGHSSHHPKGIEVYRDRLILYGCGDFLNDYEGIGGYEGFRGDLTIAYFAELLPATGHLLRLEIVPFQMRNFRLTGASREGCEWLATTLDRESTRFGARVECGFDGALTLRWR